LSLLPSLSTVNIGSTGGSTGALTLWTGWTLAILVVGFAKEYYMDGATVLIVALAVGFVLVVMFFVLEARKHAGKWMDSDN